MDLFGGIQGKHKGLCARATSAGTALKSCGNYDSISITKLRSLSLYDSVDGSYTSATVLADSVPGESAAKARKYLRRDMENNLAEGSRNFLEALGEVVSVSRFFPSTLIV